MAWGLVLWICPALSLARGLLGIGACHPLGVSCTWSVPLILTERGTEAPVSGDSPKLACFLQDVQVHDRDPGHPQS